MVEDGAYGLAELSAGLYPHTGSAYTIGLTGSPGVGKSSLAAQLVQAGRSHDLAVAVLAIDPTSPFTGGALLGDRLRMQSHATDPGVFIRSMATRGHLGGMALAAPEAVRILDASGKDVIVVETVGVGQAEVEDRKSTRLNSSHSQISYAVFCLKKKKTRPHEHHDRLPDRLRRHRSRTPQPLQPRGRLSRGYPVSGADHRNLNAEPRTVRLQAVP